MCLGLSREKSPQSALRALGKGACPKNESHPPPVLPGQAGIHSVAGPFATRLAVAGVHHPESEWLPAFAGKKRGSSRSGHPWLWTRTA